MKSPHIERMECELAELSERAEKLAIFIDENPIFAGLALDAQGLMRMQLGAMRQYETALSLRLQLIGRDTDSGGTPPPPPPPGP